MSNNVGIFDKIVISMAILSFIVAFFKAGIMAAIGKFFCNRLFLRSKGFVVLDHGQ
ncbi:hypothetical protein [Vibrio parahaemolyticus]|uniref:hypothetical protein n=1 Tax=Vibrio parahaemolyticus TaxID=670 RepID=UPI0015DDA4C5|nr:hypothetical protein [Vibrio parahaemolyticus]EIO5094932.1 hypothetical protein [Vibrio parahaemolyticus]MDF4485672.1 hypothetical protein [Vibrio parahaemolyticus]MDG3380499.1 hypothetical protein [Vibrio parahaemolyticus]